MNVQKPLLLIPVENQVRELDAKLLLACAVAKRGIASVIGPRRQVEFRISSFPRSIFISKDLTSGNGRLFRILDQLGHVSVAWDEEGLIHQPPEIYFKERFAASALKYVSHLFAWGPNNEELWRQFSEMPADKPIHITGNPRGDMLRNEMRPFFEDEVKQIQQVYKDFILINTNFGAVNAFTPIQNLIQSKGEDGAKPELGRTAKGMDGEYAVKYQMHIQSIFEDIKQLILDIDKAFPEMTIVVRPHPDEDPQVYHDIASSCRNVRVTNEGNVLPWLIATRALIHNGCTTGVEAYAMGVPAIAYRATADNFFDKGIYHLPNVLSHQCFSFGELQRILERILAGQLGVPNGNEPQALFKRYFSAQEGAFAAERIADIIEKLAASNADWPQPGLRDRLEGRYRAVLRRFKKRFKSYLSTSASITPDFERHRYPGISLAAMQRRISRFQQVLKYKEEIKAVRISRQLYKISTQGN
jgi:surface carbohydrate biosynthesis protein